MKKEIFFLIILFLGIGGGFFGGMKYQESKIPQRSFFPREGRENIRQVRERMIAGEIIAKDEKSLTLKLADGSTRIVFISDSTKIAKMTNGTLADVETGKQVMVIGNQTSQGTFLAEQIQLSSPFFERR